MEQSLTGKRVLVTGSSRGIGRAVALDLARCGADVIVHCSANTSKAEEVSREIAAMGRKTQVVQADLSLPCGADGFIAETGPVDILILNASVQLARPWAEITDAEFDTQINCNFRSSLKLIQQYAPAMKEKHWGRIVTIGSVQEVKPHPDMLIYSASKAAQSNMVRSLASQLAPFGITVNNVGPGVVNTDRNAKALADPAYVKHLMSLIPVGFCAEAEDMTGIVRLLCTEEGRYITGQNIYPDGGKSL